MGHNLLWSERPRPGRARQSPKQGSRWVLLCKDQHCSSRCSRELSRYKSTMNIRFGYRMLGRQLSLPPPPWLDDPLSRSTVPVSALHRWELGKSGNCALGSVKFGGKGREDGILGQGNGRPRPRMRSQCGRVGGDRAINRTG